MFQIRKNVFETNSSSSHSLCILKEDQPLDGLVEMNWRLDNDGILHFYNEDDLQFSRWPFRILNNWYDRLCYALASYAYDSQTREKIIDICRKHIKNFVNFEFPKNPWWDEEGPYFYGCVDHQSMNLLSRFLKTHNVSLEDFIFNDRYLVIIDGDEYCYFDELQGLPIWNKDAVEEIYD